MNHSMVIEAILFIPTAPLMLDLACSSLPICKHGTYLMNGHPEGGLCGRRETFKVNALIVSTTTSSWLQGNPQSSVLSACEGLMLKYMQYPLHMFHHLSTLFAPLVSSQLRACSYFVFKIVRLYLIIVLVF